MTSHRGQRRLLTLAIAATTLFAACGGSDAPAAETTASAPDTATPAVTESASTEPPATDPPATDPAVTDPAVTDPPATDPPATDPPATEAPPETDGESDIPFVAPSSFDPEVDAPICLRNLSEDDLADYVLRSCDEPHDAELVALAMPAFDVMPDNAPAGSVALRELCGPLVAAYTGQDLTGPGIGVGFDSPNGLGDEVVAPVSCLASISVPALLGSFRDFTIEEVLGDTRILAQLEPGTCFEFAGDSFDLGFEIDCTADGAIMAIGTYEMQDRDVYPEDLDVLRAERTEACTALLKASGLSGDPSTISGTFAPGNNYVALGQRTATCDVTPI